MRKVRRIRNFILAKQAGNCLQCCSAEAEMCRSLSHMWESKFPSLPRQDGRRQTDSQVGIWSMYQRVPRRASHSLYMSCNYCHGKLNTHQAIYETYFCRNTDNASLTHRDSDPMQFQITSKWLIYRGELHEGREGGQGGGRGKKKRWRGDRGYVHLSVEPLWFGADDVSAPSSQSAESVNVM